MILRYYWGERKLHFSGLLLIKMCTSASPERGSSARHTGSCDFVSWTQPPRWHGNHSSISVSWCAHKSFWGFWRGHISIWFQTVPASVSLGCHAQLTVGIVAGIWGCPELWEWLMSQCMVWIGEGGIVEMSVCAGDFASPWVILYYFSAALQWAVCIWRRANSGIVLSNEGCYVSVMGVMDD